MNIKREREETKIGGLIKEGNGRAGQKREYRKRQLTLKAIWTPITLESF